MKNTATAKTFCSALTVAGIGVVSHSASAMEPINVDVGGGLEYHSNAAQVSTNEKSDVARMVRAGVTWRDPVGPVSGDVGYNVERRDFADNVEDDETAVDGRAALRWDVAPRLLDIIVQHQISQSQIDQRTTNTPSNRERRSVLTGGFDGYLHLSPVDSVIISPRYTDVSFGESTQSDSRRANADVMWQHELSAVSKLGVSAGVGRVRFDDSLQDYDSSNAQLSYEAALARLNYSVAAGYTNFDRDHQKSVDGHSLHLSANYHGEGFDVGGNAVSELTDSSLGLVQNEFTLGNNFSASDSNFNQVDVIQRSQVDVYWRQQFNVASALDLGVGATKDDYKDTPRDEDAYYAQAGYRYTLNTRWSLGLRARYQHRNFLDDPRDLEYDDTIYTASVQYRFSQRLDIQLSVSRDDRNANISDRDYTDDIAAISFNYRLF